MNLRKAWIDTTRHRIPRLARAVRDRFAAAKIDPGTEIASDTNAALSAISSWAATNPVDTLQRGRDPEKGIDYLRSMENKDAHYAAMLESRKMGLLSHDWNIVPAPEDKTGEDKAAFVQWNFETIDGTLTEKIRNMLDAIPIGFSVQEKIFEKVGAGDWAGKWRLKNLKDKDQKNFSFKTDKFGNLLPDGVRYKQRYGLELPLPPEKFIIYVFNKKYGSWYGNGVGVVCSWYSWFKKDGLKFWLLLLQKFGNPTVKGKVPEGAKTGDRDQFKNIIESLAERTGITLPPGFEVELLEATRQGEAGYIKLLDYCDKQISKRLVGATLTAEPGEVGSYALGQVHAGIREEFVKFDALSVQDAINEQVIKPLVDFNFADTTDYPRFEFIFEQPVDRKALAETLKLAQEAGVVIPMDWAHEELRIPAPQEGEESLVPAPKPAGGMPFADDIIDVALKSKPFTEEKPSVEGRFQAAALGPVQDKSELPALNLSRPLNQREQLFADIPGVSLQLNRVLEAGMGDGRKAYTTIRDDILEQVKKKLTVRGQIRGSLWATPIVVNVSRLKQVMVNQSMETWLWGMLHGTNELERMGFRFRQARLDRFQEGDVTATPMQAVKYFRNKIPLTKTEFAAKTAVEQDRYFTMAGLAKADIEKTVQPLLLQAIERGDTFEDVKKAVSESMIKYTGDIYGGAVKAGEPLAEYHLATTFRTNLMGSYNVGRMDIYHDPDLGGFIQALQNSSVMDDSTTDQCWKLDETIYKIDDPIWQIITPPGHYHCRRIVIAVPYYEKGVKFSPPPTEDMMPAKGFEVGYVPSPGTPAAKAAKVAPKVAIPTEQPGLIGKEWAKTFNEDEKRALLHWQRSGYTPMRYYQQSGIGSAEIKKEVANLTAALNRAKPYEGTVYRGLNNLKAADFKKISNAKTIRWDALASAADNERTASMFLMPGENTKNILFKIQNKTGVDITPIVGRVEGEVILKQGAEYRVLGVVQKTETTVRAFWKYLEITLQEI